MTLFKINRIGLLIALVVAAVAMLPTASTESAQEYQWWGSGSFADCTGAGPGTITPTVNVDYNFPSNVQLYETWGLAGATSVSGPNVWSGSASFQFTYAPINFNSYPVTFIDWINIWSNGELIASDRLSVTCTGPGTFSATVEYNYLAGPVPGCDVMIPIPDTAVGATITADTPVYWKPGEMSDETFPAGLTLRALGVDASGVYTKVLYVCGTYWVPTGAVGPNYDAPWNGAPLPTGVVN
jgi:hypothetical protein